MIGGCLALILRGHRFADTAKKTYCRAANVYVGLVAWSMAILSAFHPGTESNYLPIIATFGYTVIATAFAALIYLAIQPGTRWNRFFSVAWLRSFGKYSYGIYVLHILVGYLVSTTLRQWLGTSLRIWLTPRLHSRPAAILVEFAVSVSVVYAAAWLSYNLYEVRFLRLKRRFS